MDNIIFEIKNHPLGDEINMTRNILLDLLFQKYITRNVVILCHKDRLFLYKNIFNNTYLIEDGLEIEDIKKICDYKFNKDFLPYLLLPNLYIFPSHFWIIYGSYKNMLDKNIVITNEWNLFNFKKINYYNSQNHSIEFKNLVTNIEYLNELPKFNNEKFIVYHHRVKNDGAWDQNDETLEKILTLKNKYNIVIFSQKQISINDKNIYMTSNLKEFATFINSDKCLALISVWSGGGQFGCYCNNKKIILYFEECQDTKEDNIINDVEYWVKSENAYDFCKFSDCERIFIKKEELNNIEKYI
jgi:hypothetical protein